MIDNIATWCNKCPLFQLGQTFVKIKTNTNVKKKKVSYIKKKKKTINKEGVKKF